MKTDFYLLLSLKTPNGFENYGQYFLGNNRETAYNLFESMSGNGDLNSPALLHIDLMETINDLPVRIKTICCTLNELASNTKIIAREVFRQKNLKNYEE